MILQISRQCANNAHGRPAVVVYGDATFLLPFQQVRFILFILENIHSVIWYLGAVLSKKSCQHHKHVLQL